jgi:hypothetical protein
MAVKKERFAEELEAFEARRADLLSGHEREWVVVHKDIVVGPFKTSEEAWREGVDRFGLGTFMLRRVLRPEDEPIIVSHIAFDAEGPTPT